jgi:SARP family transcriptional regulator, regulator of embCAB operon
MHPMGWGLQEGQAMRICVFGAIEVRCRDRRLGPAELGGRKPKQVLELLVAARGRPVSKDRLIDQLWGENPPRHPAAALENHIWVLRRHLPSVDADGVPWILGGSGNYRLATERIMLDLDHFDHLVSRAAREGLVVGRHHLAEAIALVRGDVFADEPYTEWAVALRESYRMTFQGVLLDAAEAAAVTGDANSTVRLAARAMANEPLSERACRLRMWGHSMRAEREQALRVYQDFRAALRAELDMDPLVETVALRDRILAGTVRPWLDGVGARASMAAGTA